MGSPAPSALFLGRLERDFLINAQGQALIDHPGGNLLYAAAAYHLWGNTPGLVARVGSDYPEDWLNNLEKRGFDVRGVNRLAQAYDLRRFIAYSDIYTAHHQKPVKYFAELGLPFPKALLGYQFVSEYPDSKRERGPIALRPEDIPADYAGIAAAHLCPLDYLSHSLMPAALRAAGVELITLDAGAGYMQPKFWTEVPDLVNGLSVFLVDEEKLRTLFAKRTEDIWKMMEGIASYNCNAVVVKSIPRGQWLLDANSGKRYHLPPYPSRVADLTSAGSSFCGGFLAGLQESGELVRALLVGSATASVAMEGSGAFYVSDSLTGLVEARISSLEQALKPI